MRRLGLFIAVGLIVGASGCGGDDPVASDQPAAHAPKRVSKARSSRVPATRADGHEWPSVPAELRAAVSGEVLVAGTASRQTVRALRCFSQRGYGPNSTRRFLNANVDEFSLKATYTEIVPKSDGGEVAGKRVVTDCSARWDPSREGWRKVACGPHYAPAWTREAVTRSGGGMLDYCDEYPRARVPGGPYALIWLVPPKGARWLVVHRDRGYAIAYPVSEREPIRAQYPLSDAPQDKDRHFRVFRFDAVSRSGRVTHVRVRGAVAG
jgi:hypothetical protein